MTDLKKFLKDLSKTSNVTVSEFEDYPVQKLDVIPTGSYTLDKALGVGGWPRGRIIEIHGVEASGKTLMTMLALAEAQKKGLKAAYIDMEQSFSPDWASTLGVDVDKLIITQPDYGDQALEIAEELAKTNEIGLIVIDSLASLIPKRMKEKKVEDQTMGIQAKMMSEALQRLVPIANKSNTAVIFINQVRNKIGVTYGNPETTPGGSAMKFYASVRVKMKKESGSEIKNDEKLQVGHTVNAKVVKNKVAPPFKSGSFTVNYYSGVDRESELVDIAVDTGIIGHPNKVSYEYKDAKWRGRDALINGLREDKAMRDEIEKAVLNKSEEPKNGETQ